VARASTLTRLGDNDGVRDPDDRAIPGVPVELWLDADGDGRADDVNGDGSVDDDGIDPPNLGAPVLSGPIVLSAADEPGDPNSTGGKNFNPTVEFGFHPLAGIGDRVWLDDNRDGIQDPDEQPVAGVTVELLDEDGNVVAATVTDSDGRYQLTNLVPGAYRIRFDLDTQTWPQPLTT